MNIKNLLLTLLSLIIIFPVHAQVVFEKTYGGAEYDFGTTVRETPTGEYFIAGVYSAGTNAGDYYIIKTNKYGDTIWTKKNKSYGATEIYKIQMDVTLDSSVLFIQNSQSGPDNWNMTVTKINFDGSINWENEYPNMTHGANTLSITSDTGCIITYFDDVFYIKKLDKHGNVHFNVPVTSCLTFSSICEEDGYVFGGISMEESNKFVLTKTDLYGTLLWSKAYSEATLSEGIINSGISKSNDGGYMMYTTLISNDYTGYVLKFDHSGDTIWSKKYLNLSLTDGIQNDVSSYVVTGFHTAMQNDSISALLLKISNDGTSIFQKHFNIEQYAAGLGISKTSDDGYVIAGFQEIGTEADIYLIKCDSDGNITDLPYNRSPEYLLVYPNPTNGKIFVNTGNNEKVVVFDIYGKIVYSGFDKEIDLEQQQKGIYMIEVIKDKKKISSKLILK